MIVDIISAYTRKTTKVADLRCQSHLHPHTPKQHGRKEEYASCHKECIQKAAAGCTVLFPEGWGEHFAVVEVGMGAGMSHVLVKRRV